MLGPYRCQRDGGWVGGWLERQDELSQKSYCLVDHVEELGLAVWQVQEHKYRILNQSLHWMQMWKVVTKLK